MKKSGLKIARFFLLAGLVLVAVSGLRAQTPSSFLFGNPFRYSGQDGNFGTLGTSFTIATGYALTITSVGYWDAGNDGVAGTTPISVALFNNGTQQIITGSQIDFLGTDGGSDVVPVGGVGEFRFEALSAPIVLTAGDYTIAEWNYGLNPNDRFGNFSGGLNYNGSTFGDSVTAISTTIAPDFASNGVYPSALNSRSADFFAGNFKGYVSAVPEPSTYAMMAVGLGVLGAWAARRRSCRVG